MGVGGGLFSKTLFSTHLELHCTRGIGTLQPAWVRLSHSSN